MRTGLLGKKLGMTQIFAEDGRFIPVSVVEVGPCPVLEVKEKVVSIGFEQVKESRAKKPQLGLFKKAGVAPCRLIKEFPKDPSREYKLGEELKVDLFQEGDYVDVTGVSIGKGFQGGMKRWGWSSGPRTHGSMSHRRVGSIGSSADPSRVFKGRHLPGHMGSVKVTTQNLQVVKVDTENNLLLIKGALPGCRNNYLIVNQAKKKPLAPREVEAKAQEATEEKKAEKKK